MTKTKKVTKRRRGQSASKAMLSVSSRHLRSELKKLRVIIDTNQDPILVRMAYEVETALTWASEKTVGWEPPSKSVVSMTNILRAELQAPRNARYR